MLIRNKNTGAVWDISDQLIITRCMADPKSYEEVKPDPAQKAETAQKDEKKAKKE